MKQDNNPILYAEYESAYMALSKAEYMLTVQELMLFINLRDKNNTNDEKEIENRRIRLINLKENTLNCIKQYTMDIDNISKDMVNNLKEMIE
ncbi:hypothetical protein [Methanobrevibacter sp. UBA188]|uniref:hypothetical protein n=1 Tax=Methanobrevibacter sp. UBA188 TaxID=1915473 RepID=UPI0025DFE2B5|nr:hypothetical protein [Methanobrevibacter sp. UBA188]